MSLGMPEIIVILAVTLLLFGPKKLPELARGIGQSVREFKKGTQGLRDELESSLHEDAAPARVEVTALSPRVEVTASAAPTPRADTVTLAARSDA